MLGTLKGHLQGRMALLCIHRHDCQDFLQPYSVKTNNNCKKIISAAVSPKSKEIKNSNINNKRNIISQNSTYKKTNNNISRYPNSLVRTIRSQPISPESSIYKTNKSIMPNKPSNKIEQAKNELVQWIIECI